MPQLRLKEHIALFRPTAEAVLVHLDWAPAADAGTGRQQVRWQNAALGKQVCESLV